MDMSREFSVVGSHRSGQVLYPNQGNMASRLFDAIQCVSQNRAFLQAVMAKRVPPELLVPGHEIDLRMEKKNEEHQQRKMKPFSYKGHFLGSVTPDVVGGPSASAYSELIDLEPPPQLATLEETATHTVPQIRNLIFAAKPSLAYRPLPDGLFLDEVLILPDHILSPKPSTHEPKTQIFVNTPAKSIALSVHPTDTVLRLKNRIYRRTGISPDDQLLMYGGKQLLDGMGLFRYHIRAESTLELSLRIRGGVEETFMEYLWPVLMALLVMCAIAISWLILILSGEMTEPRVATFIIGNGGAVAVAAAVIGWHRGKKTDEHNREVLLEAKKKTVIDQKKYVNELEAKEAHVKSVKVAYSEVAATEHEIAELYFELGDLHEALRHYNLALHFGEEDEDPLTSRQSIRCAERGAVLVAIGKHYKAMAEYDKARVAYEEALRLDPSPENREAWTGWLFCVELKGGTFDPESTKILAEAGIKRLVFEMGRPPSLLTIWPPTLLRSTKKKVVGWFSGSLEAQLTEANAIKLELLIQRGVIGSRS